MNKKPVYFQKDNLTTAKLSGRTPSRKAAENRYLPAFASIVLQRCNTAGNRQNQATAGQP
jgi:hypothetical protein